MADSTHSAIFSLTIAEVAAWAELLRDTVPPTLDLSGIAEIDGAGVQCLLAVRRKFPEVALLRPSEPVRRAVSQLGLSSQLGLQEEH